MHRLYVVNVVKKLVSFGPYALKKTVVMCIFDHVFNPQLNPN